MSVIKTHKLSFILNQTQEFIHYLENLKPLYKKNMQSIFEEKIYLENFQLLLNV